MSPYTLLPTDRGTPTSLHGQCIKGKVFAKTRVAQQEAVSLDGLSAPGGS